MKKQGRKDAEGDGLPEAASHMASYPLGSHDDSSAAVVREAAAIYGALQDVAGAPFATLSSGLPHLRLDAPKVPDGQGATDGQRATDGQGATDAQGPAEGQMPKRPGGAYDIEGGDSLASGAPALESLEAASPRDGEGALGDEAVVIMASEFKAKCLDILDQVNTMGKVYKITKRGQVVAVLMPPVMPKPAPAKPGFAAGLITMLGDIEAPLDVEWDALVETDGNASVGAFGSGGAL